MALQSYEPLRNQTREESEDKRLDKLCKPRNSPFLNGLRGVASYMVMLEHSFYEPGGWSLQLFEWLGSISVRVFFVLSSYLITYRLLLEWHRYKLHKYSVRRDAGESRFAWLTGYKEEVLMVIRYAVKRVLRVYPLYCLVVFATFSSKNLGDAYWTTGQPMSKYLLLNSGRHIFWTVPVEMKFYLIIPFIVMAYHFATRGEVKSLTSWMLRIKCFSLLGPARLRTITRTVCFVVFCVAMRNGFVASLLEAEKPNGDDARIVCRRWYSVFLAGCVAAIGTFELQMRGLLPNNTVPTAPMHTDIEGGVGGRPRRNVRALLRRFTSWFCRFFADIACYLLLMFWMATSLNRFRYTAAVKKLVGPWIVEHYMPHTVQMDGIVHAAIIFLAVYSQRSYTQLWSGPQLAFLGKVSFSSYLLHPGCLQLVWRVWYPGSVFVRDGKDDYKNNWFDKFIIFTLVTFAAAMVTEKLVESPSIRLGSYICRRWFTTSKPIKARQPLKAQE
ncbi:hypothetical protein RI367_002643 [Sorochytrium milnesiophthora]